MGSASAEIIGEERGYFDGTIFNNGRIIMEVGKDYAVMKDARNGEVLIERIYPEVQVREGEEWRYLDFEKDIKVDENNGWHSVSILMEHRGNVDVRGFLQYAQKSELELYRPLYPSMVLWFNRSVEYRVICRYEGVHIRNFEVIDNGTGWTRPPYREGHGRIVLYNGTVNRRMIFGNDADILLGWNNGYKEFGLNWERHKEEIERVVIDGEGEKVSISIESDPEYTTLGMGEPPYPIPDSGGGGGSSDDTDNDGLTDYEEIYTYHTYAYTWDSDGDELSDLYEVRCGEPAGGWQEPRYYNGRYAVIIYGDSVNLPKVWYQNLCDSVYEYLLDIGYDAENIFYLGYGDSGRGGVDMNTTIDNITYVFNYLSNKMTSHDFLFLFWVGHGISPYAHSFLIGAYPYVTISFSEIAQLLDTLTPKRMVLVFHPCFSGGIIPYVSGESRVVLTSTKYNEEDNGWGELFRDGLVGNGDLLNPDGDPNTLDSHGNQDGYVSMDEAYYYAAYRAYNDLSTHQHSLIEDYIGNGRSGSWYEEESYDPQQETKEGYLAAHTYL